jgi:hypothetical protein
MKAFSHQSGIKRLSPFFIKHRLIGLISKIVMSFYKIIDNNS